MSELCQVGYDKIYARRKYVQNLKSDKRELIRRTERVNQQYQKAVHDLSVRRANGKRVDDAVVHLNHVKRSKKKLGKILKAQGLGDYINTTGVQILDIMRAIIEACQATRDVIGESFLNTLIDITTTLYNVWSNPTWESLLVNATSLFLRYFDQYVTDLIISWLKNLLFKCTAQGIPIDTISTLITQLFNSADHLINDELWERIGEFTTRLSIVIAAAQDMINIEQINMDIALSKFKILRQTLPAAKDIVDMMFQSLTFVMGSWDKIIKGDFSCIFLGKSEAQEFEVEVRLLEQSFPLVQARQEIELRTIYNMTLAQYDQRVEKALKTAKSLITRCTSTQQKMAVSNFVRNLSNIQGELFARVADAPTSEQAYAIKISGPSSCGKSTLVNLFSQTLLNAYGLDPADRGQIVFTNIEERYESTIKPSHQIICADDVANNANSRPNYDRLLNYVNSVPRPLEKADVKEKGILYPGNKAFIATTNDELIKALECSICPESILRRFTLDIEVEIKEQYRTEYGGLIPQDGMNMGVYQLRLKRFSHIERNDGKSPIVHWDVIPRSEWNSYDDDEHDLHAACQFLARDVASHRSRQKKIMTTQKQLLEGGCCGVCRTPQLLCTCDKELKAELGNFLSAMSTADLWNFRVNLNVTTLLRNQVSKIILYKSLWNERHTISRIMMAILGTLLVSSIISVNIARVLLLIWSIIGYRKYTQILRHVDEELARRSDYLSSVCTNVRDHLHNNTKKYFAIGATLLAVYGFYRAFRPIVSTQDVNTVLEPVLEKTSTVIDGPKGHVLRVRDERLYKEGYSRHPPKTTHQSDTTTANDLRQLIARFLRVVVVKVADNTYATVNGMFVTSNILMVPAHVIPESNFTVETTANPGSPDSKTKDVNLTSNYVYRVPEKDVVLVHLPSAPPARNLIDYFPVANPTFLGRATQLLWKSPSNEVKISYQSSIPLHRDVTYEQANATKGWLYGARSKTHTLKSENGLKSNLEFNTFAGLCGAPLIDREKAIIYGFHVAGYGCDTTSYSTLVVRNDLLKGIESLTSTSSHMTAHAEGCVRVDAYGADFSLVNKRPLYCREDGTKANTIVTYLGKVVDSNNNELQSNARSPYLPTPYSGITREFGVCTHIPPTDVNSVTKTMKTLNKLTDPVQHYDLAIMEKAIADFKDQTLSAVREHKEELRSVLRIFTQQEALDGTSDNVLYGIPNSTSGGFPMNKSKKQALKRDPFDESIVQVPREFNGEYHVQEEIDMVINAWSNGERSETIFKASSKVNELLPRSKAIDKVRKFYGSQFGFLVSSRRVLGGVAAFMQQHWRETECLVGIDPGSREWTDLYTHLTTFGSDHMIAGDFSGFDTRMAAQVTLAAAKIIMSWYEEMGLPENELTLIKGALSDICNPNILIESDLYRFANANPSGQPITVQLNSLCNSIMMRYVYYALRPNIKERFSENVKLATYGDDNGMGVAKHCTFYTHTACQKEFEKVGIGYTMADKNAISRPYININELSFLKREFVRHAELGAIVAPIELDSIYKKYHFVKKPSESPLSFEAQYGAYTDSALREAALHGRTFYNNFLESLRRIQQENTSLRGHLSLIPYNDMIDILKPKYAKNYVPVRTPAFN